MAKPSIPLPPPPGYRVPNLKVEDVVYSLGKLEYAAEKSNFVETRERAEEIRKKLEGIYLEAAVIAGFLLDYLETHDKVDKYCFTIINKLRELVRGRYFRA